MNRRDLFRGAGALALTAAMPVVWPDPVYDNWVGLDLSSAPDSTAIWVVSWGAGMPPTSWRTFTEEEFFEPSPLLGEINWLPGPRLPR